MNDKKLAKIRNYLKVALLPYWRSGTERIVGGNVSISDIELALKIDTLKGYKQLVFDLYEDENDDEAETLERLIAEAEKTK